MQLYIPQYKVHPRQDPIWYNSEIRHCINHLRTLCHRFKHHPIHHVSSIIASTEDSLKEKIKVAKIPSVMNLDLLNTNTDSSKANLFNQYFHSIFYNSTSLPNIEDLPMVNDSLHSIAVPEVYEALISLDAEKSAGIDNISPR